MNSRKASMSAIFVTVLMFLTIPASAQDEACSVCGPWENWISDCPQGVDEIHNQGAVLGIDMDLDCAEDQSLILGPCGAPQDLLIISRSAPHDGGSTIDTEIIQMCLTGGGMYLYNHEPMRVQTLINCIPPSARYIHVLDCLPLYTHPIAGDHVANLVRAEHTVETLQSSWGRIKSLYRD